MKNSEYWLLLMEHGALDDKVASVPCGGHDKATLWVHDENGELFAEEITSATEIASLTADAPVTGCYRRSRAIRDPSSGEITGYEMQQTGFARSLKN